MARRGVSKSQWWCGQVRFIWCLLHRAEPIPLANALNAVRKIARGIVPCGSRYCDLSWPKPCFLSLYRSQSSLLGGDGGLGPVSVILCHGRHAGPWGRHANGRPEDALPGRGHCWGLPVPQQPWGARRRAPFPSCLFNPCKTTTTSEWDDLCLCVHFARQIFGTTLKVLELPRLNLAKVPRSAFRQKMRPRVAKDETCDFRPMACTLARLLSTPAFQISLVHHCNIFRTTLRVDSVHCQAWLGWRLSQFASICGQPILQHLDVWTGKQKTDRPFFKRIAHFFYFSFGLWIRDTKF